MSLQQQVRQRIVDAISHGTLRPGRRLPASRQLAAPGQCLAQYHNTGLRLAAGRRPPAKPPAQRHLRGAQRASLSASPPDGAVLRHAASVDPGNDAPRDDGGFRVPPNWLQYPYPFIDGCIEPELIPVEGWREALRLASSKQELLRWGTGAGDPDDARLIDELRTKVLPSWGLDAAPDELLATVSGQQALHLVLATLVDRSTPVVIDASIDAEVQRQLRARGAYPRRCSWDGAGSHLADTAPARGDRLGRLAPRQFRIDPDARARRSAAPGGRRE